MNNAMQLKAIIKNIAKKRLEQPIFIVRKSVMASLEFSRGKSTDKKFKGLAA